MTLSQSRHGSPRERLGASLINPKAPAAIVNVPSAVRPDEEIAEADVALCANAPAFSFVAGPRRRSEKPPLIVSVVVEPTDVTPEWDLARRPPSWLLERSNERRDTARHAPSRPQILSTTAPGVAPRTSPTHMHFPCPLATDRTRNRLGSCAASRSHDEPRRRQEPRIAKSLRQLTMRR